MKSLLTAVLLFSSTALAQYIVNPPQILTDGGTTAAISYTATGAGGFTATNGSACYTLSDGATWCDTASSGKDSTINGNLTVGANDGGPGLTVNGSVSIPDSGTLGVALINITAPTGTIFMTTQTSDSISDQAYGWEFSGNINLTGYLFANSIGYIGGDILVDYNGSEQTQISSTTGKALWEANGSDTNTMITVETKFDGGLGSVAEFAPWGFESQVVDAGYVFTPFLDAGSAHIGTLLVGSGTQITNHCVTSVGACSMASTTTCTATCTGCTTASVCVCFGASSAATTNAVGTYATCSSGTITITAKVGTTGTETFSCMCDN